MSAQSETQVVGLGAGGHSKVLIEALRLLGVVTLMGLLDARRELEGSEVLGVPVIGDDDLLPGLYERGVRHAFIGLGSASDTGPRRLLYQKARGHGFGIVDVIHPRAFVSPSATLGHGVTVMACAVVNADARVGENVLVNTGAIIEHDCVVGDHVHVATGARLASSVQVGDGVHIGVGASVRQCARIGRNAVVGAGATVVSDVSEGVVVVGTPARVLKRV